MLSNSRLLLLCSASLLALSACNFTEQSGSTSAGTGTAKSPVAATVDGHAISELSVDMLSRQRAAQGQPDTADGRKAIIEHLSMQYLIAQEALKKGLDKSPEAQDQIELTKQSILANAFVQDFLKNAPVSDETLKAEYEKIKGQMSANEYKARHILVDKEVDAKEIIAKLKKNPKAFDALAKAQSKDPGSKGNGGDLGWFDPRGMVPEFGTAVAKLEKGKFTEEPVKSQFGFHVILLEDTRPKQVPPLEQVKPMLLQQVQQQSLRKLFDDMKAKAKIEIVAAKVPATAPATEAKPTEAKPAEAKPAEPAKKP
ncbi:MAG: peptidylprolyl isomerase [Sterolibacterium sp.]